MWFAEGGTGEGGDISMILHGWLNRHGGHPRRSLCLFESSQGWIPVIDQAVPRRWGRHGGLPLHYHPLIDTAVPSWGTTKQIPVFF